MIDEVSQNSSQLRLCINDFMESYDGKFLHSLFLTFCDQKDKVLLIENILRNYVLILQNVNKAYVEQDFSFFQQLTSKKKV